MGGGKESQDELKEALTSVKKAENLLVSIQRGQGGMVFHTKSWNTVD